MAEVKEGDRIELIYTDDPYTNLQPGDQGSVVGLGETPGDMVQIDVKWDSGSTLSLIEGVDRYKIVSSLIVKSQAEEPIAEEPTEKEFEMESLSDYDDIKFAITWKDQIPTDEEMEVVKKHFIDEGYEEESFNIMVFGDFLDQLYDQIESDGGTLSDYVDEASMIHDRILNGELDLIKTSTGYVAVELYH